MSQRNEAIQIVQGIMLAFGIDFAALTIGTTALWILDFVSPGLPSRTFTSTIIQNFIAGLLYIFRVFGLAQTLYVVPLIVLLRRRQKWELMKGVIVGAVIIAFLSRGCWLTIYFAFK
jgi:hypothetical protein